MFYSISSLLSWRIMFWSSSESANLSDQKTFGKVVFPFWWFIILLRYTLGFLLWCDKIHSFTGNNKKKLHESLPNLRACTISLYKRLFEESSEASLIYLEINAFIDTEHKDFQQDRYKKETYLSGRMNQTAKNSLFSNCNIGIMFIHQTFVNYGMNWSLCYSIP